MTKPYPTTAPGEALLQQIVENESRFDELYDLLYDRVYAYVYRRTYDIQASRDIVANTVFKQIKQQAKFRWQGAPQFYAWIFRVAMNEVSLYYRRGKKYQLVEDWLDVEVSDEPSTTDRMISEEQSRAIHRAVEDLPDKLSRVVELYYFAELSHGEIAVALGITETASRVRLHRAIQELQTIITKENE